jgi:hypothetical protein
VVNTSFDDYRRALAALRDLPVRAAADFEHARQTHAQASSFADRAASAAGASASGAVRAVEAQLSAARAALEPLGRANLIPPRIRPSQSFASATREDVAKAQQELAAAVNYLREAVRAEIRRIEGDNERLAREAVERERLAREAAERERLARDAAERAAIRRKKLIWSGITAVLGLIAVILILIVVL